MNVNIVYIVNYLSERRRKKEKPYNPKWVLPTEEEVRASKAILPWEEFRMFGVKWYTLDALFLNNSDLDTKAKVAILCIAFYYARPLDFCQSRDSIYEPDPELASVTRIPKKELSACLQNLEDKGYVIRGFDRFGSSFCHIRPKLWDEYRELTKGGKGMKDSYYFYTNYHITRLRYTMDLNYKEKIIIFWLCLRCNYPEVSYTLRKFSLKGILLETGLSEKDYLKSIKSLESKKYPIPDMPLK